MAYTAPPNFVAGAVLTEAQLDILSDDITFLANPPKCRVYMSAALSVANTTNTAVTFNSERFDTDTMHSTSANTDRITFTTAGTYLVGANLGWAASTAGSRYVDFLVNGATQIPGEAVEAYDEAGFGTMQAPSTLYAFTAGQYVTLRVRQNSGGALNLDTCEFWAVWVSL